MIEVNNLTDFEIDEKFIKKIVREILKQEKKKKELKMSIALVSPQVIKKLNRTYRKKNRITDILSFSASDPKTAKADFFREKKDLGEIIICPQKVKKNSQKYKTDFEAEFLKVLIHGVLHLLKYDHERSKKKAKQMDKKQKFYFTKFI